MASFGVSQYLCFRRTRVAVSVFWVVENWDRENNNKNLVGVVVFRGTTTRARVREIIFCCCM
ncbi:hypothetical protein JHK87_037294 [Glycine soja]|nr:hypothetical protein JHK87_037294 [Glycine soja]